MLVVCANVSVCECVSACECVQVCECVSVWVCVRWCCARWLAGRDIRNFYVSVLCISVWHVRGRVCEWAWLCVFETSTSVV